jgi:hypothetical protein
MPEPRAKIVGEILCSGPRPVKGATHTTRVHGRRALPYRWLTKRRRFFR